MSMPSFGLVDGDDPPDPDVFIVGPVLTLNHPGWSCLTLSKAKSKAQEYVDTIFSQWGKLKHILERREAVIRKRWKKKHLGQRRKVLLAAWPGMCDKHRPDCQRWFDWCKSPANECVSAWKWPQINREDLEGPEALLLFLDSRGRNPPHVFAHDDLERMHIGLRTKEIGVDGLNGYEMLLTSTRETYGKILWAPQLRKEYSDVRHELGFEADWGLLVLEVQAKILDFLLKCCVSILADVPLTELLSDELPVQTEPGPLVTTSKFGLLLASVEAPYKVPTLPDTTRLLQSIEARRDAAEDHIWEMREDPSYFRSKVLEKAMHLRPGDSRLWSNELWRDVDLWHRAVMETLISAYSPFVVWDILNQQAAKLQRLELSKMTELDSRSLLPEDLEALVTDMKSATRILSLLVSRDISLAVSQSPGIRSDLFDRDLRIASSKTKSYPVKDKMECDRLETLFSLLCDTKGPAWKELGTLAFVEEIQRVFHDNPSNKTRPSGNVQKKRLSSYATELFSDLALINHIFRDSWVFRFWLRRKEGEPLDTKRFIKLDVELFSEYLRLRKLFLYDKEDRAMLERILPLPIKEAFYYPRDKPATPANVEALRSAEQYLDKFWSGIDAMSCKKMGKSLSEMLARISKVRELRRTPPWTPPAESLGTPSCEEVICSGFSKMHVDLDQPSKFRKASTRTKVKTHGTYNLEPSIDGDVAVDEEETDTVEAPSFSLGDRDWKVFSTMFHSPSGTSSRSEIPWTDFLGAMVSIGFSCEHLYGSVWQFSPTKLNVENSIHIHEPHPASKIPFHTARRIGRRLFRNYGLNGDSFHLQ